MSKQRSRASVFGQLAVRIKREFPDWNRELPSNKALADRYGVNPKTVTKAIKALREGIGNFGSVPLAKKSQAVERLVGDLHNRIAEGVYRAGEALPKAEYLVISKKVSKTTVCDAIRRLSESGIVSKQGKKWVVGASQSDVDLGKTQDLWHREKPVVLILVDYYSLWRSTSLQHLSLFYSLLITELERYGYSYQLALRLEKGPWGLLFPTGKGQILEYINSIGSRFAGTLFLSFFTRELEEGIVDVSQWLAQFKKPIVWYEISNIPKRVVPTKIAGRELYRCRYKESRIVEIVLSKFSETGHKHIAIPLVANYKHHDWFRNRLAHAHDYIAKSGLPITLHEIEQDEPIWGDLLQPIDLVLPDFVEKRIIEASPDKDDSYTSAQIPLVRQYLRENFHSLVKIGKDKDITAIFAMNQKLAVSYYYWFRLMGIDVPQYMSIIGVDNSISLSAHCVSTVAPELEALAYQVSHIFINDIPVKSDRRGNILAQPRFIDRGTVGPPRVRATAL